MDLKHGVCFFLVAIFLYLFFGSMKLMPIFSEIRNYGIVICKAFQFTVLVCIYREHGKGQKWPLHWIILVCVFSVKLHVILFYIENLL